MMAMLEAQNKLLRSLALTIDPRFHFPNDAEEHWRFDDVDADLSESQAASVKTDSEKTSDFLRELVPIDS